MNTEMILNELKKEYGEKCGWELVHERKKEEFAAEIRERLSGGHFLYEKKIIPLVFCAHKRAFIFADAETDKIYASDMGTECRELRYPDDADDYMTGIIENKMDEKHRGGLLGLLVKLLVYGGIIVMLPYFCEVIGLGGYDTWIDEIILLASMPLLLLIGVFEELTLLIPAVTFILFVCYVKKCRIKGEDLVLQTLPLILYFIELLPVLEEWLSVMTF